MLRLVAAGSTMVLVAACGSGPPAGVTRTSPAAAATSTSLPGHASACQTTTGGGSSRVMVDWIDFVQLHGVQFIAGMNAQVPPVSVGELGTVVGRVRCELSVLTFHQTPGPTVDGDAGYLSVGTDVYAIKGYAASCRVAALAQGAYRVYLAHHDVAGVSHAVPCAKAP